MSLYEEWKNYIEENCSNEEEQNVFWEKYCSDEKVLYQKILGSKTKTIEGKVEDLAKESNMVPAQYMGFIDGISESLVTPIDLEAVELDTEIKLDVDFSKLYKNMLGVPAEWLYTLEEWNNIFSEEERDVLTKEYKRSKTVVNEIKVGRNDPCPCGSGKKYKKCCGR
ncbi:SEC-C domain-containing protein [Acetobacterium paludosum]|uniref:SEC-C domain-containing protein n=2 Tax=Acetobacterium TaxID=33951 RepID=A0A923HUJ5_9FIRM|nr:MULTISPECIES: SEC-C metal-binding domain-containing protein [Acetobacterium]MBC3795935.1 SEC-C domain-containing protein [Acetobacterium tundrae]MBC3886854.1 SEC-C domain-containing protein [Acetobacterium paludosum]